MNFSFLDNIADGLRDLFSSLMFFIPHFKTQPGEVEMEGELKKCELRGLFFLGYVVRGTITIDEPNEDKTNEDETSD